MYRFEWGVVCLLLAAAPLATAQNRTFVSSTGNSLGTITAYQSNIIENPSGVTSTPPL